MIRCFGVDGYFNLQSLHTEVLDKLHVLLAIALELPEDHFVNIHKYEVKSEVTYLSSFTCYLPHGRIIRIISDS